MSQKIVVIKSIISEEIIAELVSDIHPTEENTITLSRPRVFQVIGDEQGRPVPSIQPWIATDPDNKSVPMYRHYMATMVPATSEIEKAYLSTVSGLDLGSKLAKV